MNVTVLEKDPTVSSFNTTQWKNILLNNLCLLTVRKSSNNLVMWWFAAAIFSSRKYFNVQIWCQISARATQTMRCGRAGPSWCTIQSYRVPLFGLGGWCRAACKQPRSSTVNIHWICTPMITDLVYSLVNVVPKTSSSPESSSKKISHGWTPMISS